AEQGLIADPNVWFLYRDKHNLTVHTYDATTANEIAAILPRFAADARRLFEALQQKGQQDA
ncbi:MAG: nucleotidyltransferase, partial [Nitrospirae bacterium]